MATEKKITSRIQQKHDVAANWAKATNFIPKKGEIIIYDAEYNASGEETQAVRFKIGDGSKTVGALPFAVIDYGSDIETLEQEVADNSTDIGALQGNTVPKTRKINNKALDADITLGASDVGVTETAFPGLKKVGTVTGVKMNGAMKNPSSGIVDLGTVVTAHQSIKSINTNNTTAQTVNASEAISGSGTINLHKVAKTGSYNDLSNQPTIPAAANNGTLTIQKNGTSVATFGANQSANATANIMVPAQLAYGTCATAAGTTAKVVTVADKTWALTVGTIVGIKFTYTNTASNVTINVNNTGAKSIWYNNAKQTGNSSVYAGAANRLNYYMYDGTYWCWVNAGNEADTIPSGMCWTGAGTATKGVTCHNYNLLAKSYLQVIMTYANTAVSALKLNINGKGAKPIYINGTASSASNHTLPAGSYFVYYDGTNYYFRTDGKLTSNGSEVMTKTNFSLSGTTLTITL